MKQKAIEAEVEVEVEVEVEALLKEKLAKHNKKENASSSSSGSAAEVLALQNEVKRLQAELDKERKKGGEGVDSSRQREAMFLSSFTTGTAGLGGRRGGQREAKEREAGAGGSSIPSVTSTTNSLFSSLHFQAAGTLEAGGADYHEMVFWIVCGVLGLFATCFLLVCMISGGRTSHMDLPEKSV